MLKLMNITKEYRVEEDVTLALNDVSLEFRNNEFVSILGPSGCGKTTLLNIIGGLDRYSSGDIQIDGVSTKEYDDIDWDTYRNRRIGFVFQSYNLIPHMNILKNVALCLILAGVGREERYERALEALKKVGLDAQARKKPNQLSGGQMQRVAIARALVNNPDIILADEPTGALDTESGLQIMELLKEVAADRLVIMVTHNPQLAEEYSTRIVRLQDGQLCGDSMPYDSSEETAFTSAPDSAEVDDEEKELSKAERRKAEYKENRAKRIAKWVAFKMKRKTSRNSSMKLGTAISLSWNNLISKKGRTLLTSIAGSIGIIGIVLVLALSNGASKYISSLEESALSTYPLTVHQSSVGDVMSLLGILTQGDEESKNREKNPDSDVVYIKNVLSELIDTFMTTTAVNDLHLLKQYIDQNFDTALATVRYDYGTTFNVYIDDPSNKGKVDDGTQNYMKVNPYVEAMFIVFDQMSSDPTFANVFSGINIGGMDINEAMTNFAGLIGDSWQEMSTNQALLDQQYELVDGHWPYNSHEVVVVLNDKNEIEDYKQFMLGIKSQDDVAAMMMKPDAISTPISTADLLGLEYKVITNADYLICDNPDAPDSEKTWTAIPRNTLLKSEIDKIENTLTIKVSGVIRPKAGVIATALSGVVGYTHDLAVELINRAGNHPAVQALEQRSLEAKEKEFPYNKYKSPITFKYSTSSETFEEFIANDTQISVDDTNDEHTDLLRALGKVDMEYPKAIHFYCTTFDSKAEIDKFFKTYNETMREAMMEQGEEWNDVTPTDSLSTIMSFVSTMTKTITGVLVAFAAISLVVSTIMIAIIIYTSVLERRKEIGVLRSIGARKKDVARVFLAESAILGGSSGIIGVLTSYIISLIGSVILENLFDISGLMSVRWMDALLMFAISVVLSMIAGFIPSRIAARKDPAIALRSE